MEGERKKTQHPNIANISLSTLKDSHIHTQTWASSEISSAMNSKRIIRNDRIETVIDTHTHTEFTYRQVE